MREETRCRHMGYSFRLTARVLLYAPSHRQDTTYHGLWYTSRGALAGTRNSSMGPPWRIDPTTHRTMSERSYHGATSRSSTITNKLNKFRSQPLHSMTLLYFNLTTFNTQQSHTFCYITIVTLFLWFFLPKLNVCLFSVTSFSATFFPSYSDCNTRRTQPIRNILTLLFLVPASAPWLV